MENAKTPFFITIDDDKIDNLINNKVIKQILPNAEIKTFTDPEQGLEYIKAEMQGQEINPMVLFLDINMPILTGWEVLSKLEPIAEKLADNMSIYILSSSVNPLDKKIADKNPLVAGYISKPLTRQKIQEIAGYDSEQ